MKSTTSTASRISPSLGIAIQLPTAQLTEKRLRFETPEDLKFALSIGAFLIEIPPHLNPLTGIQFCETFYNAPESVSDNRSRGHRTKTHEDSKLGYSDRPDQVEQLQIENLHWEKYLPNEFTNLLRAMEQITFDVLSSTMNEVGISNADIEVITGGANAWCHSTVNHYRSNLRGRSGIVEHTDSGFITLLYANQLGLEILYQDTWRSVPISPSHFIVNLGDAVEILTSKMKNPIRAVIHRVPELTADRSSFTVFIGPRYDMSLYQYDEDGKLSIYQGFREFSVAKAKQLGYEFHPRL